jgi:hypothetical protein
VPSLILSAAAPVAYAVVIERLGPSGAVWFSFALASLALAAAIALRAMFRRSLRSAS